MATWLRNIWEEVARPLVLRPKRVQCAALCTKQVDGRNTVLLITSRDTGRWIIPKGWPIDGLDGAETALQEAWEEAGVSRANVDSEPVGYYSYDKVMKDGSAMPIQTNVYHIHVSELADDYPEAHERKRCWVSASDAAERVREPELQAILRQM